MTRFILLATLLAALFTGFAVKGELPLPVQPTTDAGCEADPDGRPCKPGS